MTVSLLVTLLLNSLLVVPGVIGTLCQRNRWRWPVALFMSLASVNWLFDLQSLFSINIHKTITMCLCLHLPCAFVYLPFAMCFFLAVHLLAIICIIASTCVSLFLHLLSAFLLIGCVFMSCVSARSLPDHASLFSEPFQRTVSVLWEICSCVWHCLVFDSALLHICFCIIAFDLPWTWTASWISDLLSDTVFKRLLAVLD